MAPSSPGRGSAAVAARKSLVIGRLRAAGSQWVTAAELARSAEVTTRSIRTYVNEINRSAGHTAIESTSLGYRLLDPDDLDPRSMVQDQRAEREHAIMRALALTSGGVDVFALAERLHVSDSTLESDLTRLRRRIAEDGIRITRTGDIAALTGSEEAIRGLVARLVRSEVADGVDIVSVLESAYPQHDVRGFAADLDAALAAEGHDVNDYGFASALLHIVVAIDRHQDTREPGTDSPAAGSILDTVQRHFGVTLDERGAEEVWRLLGIKALPNLSGEEDRRAATLLGAIRTRLEHDHGARLEDAESLDRFRAHLDNLLRRIDAHGFNDNPWTDSMRAGYPMVFELAATAAHEIALSTGVTVPEGEVAFLAFHLGASLHAQSDWESSITVAVHSPRYHDVATTIAQRIRQSLGHLVDVTVVTSKNATALASGADVVVSTERLVGVPVTVVTPLYGSEDAANVQRAVEDARGRRRAEHIRSTLLHCFEPALFLPELDAPDATSAIRRLGALLVDAEVIDENDIERTLEREQIASTAFVEGLAMPHSFGMGAHRTAFAVGLAPRPIPWGERNVQVVIMLAVAYADRDLFREAMDELAALLLTPGALAVVGRARDHGEFVTALRSLLAS